MKYIIICSTAVIVFPLLFFLVKRSKVEKWILTASILGFLIAGVGLLMQDLFELISIIAVLFGLVFVMTVVLDKRMKRVEETEKNHSTAAISKRQEVEEEVAAAADSIDEITLQPIDEDLARWMVEDQIDRKDGEGRRSGGA